MTQTLLVTLTLDNRRFALPLLAVERVLRACEITPLPDAPAAVVGVLDLHGRVLPVVDLRARFSLPRRALALTDQLVVARTPLRSVALMVDAVSDVIDCVGQQVTRAQDIVPGTGAIAGIAALPDGMVLIHDLEQLLSADDERRLDRALDALHAS